MKKRIKLCIALVLAALACAGCEETDSLNIDNIQNISIEIMSADDKTVTETDIEEDDVDIITDILSDNEVYSDKGFVFAEGQYRIVLEGGEETTILYPYCGNLSKFRVGDDGYSFVALDSEDEEKLREVLDKYADLQGGIWDWSEIKGR